MKRFNTKSVFTLTLILGCLGSVASLTGCKAKLALAPFDRVSAIPLQEFALAEGEEQSLFNNKLFLYPVGMQPETFAAIKLAARRYDELEGQAFPLYRQQQALEVQMNPLQEIKSAAETRIRRLSRDIPARQREIDAELAKPENERDLTRLATLQAQKEAMETERTQKTQEKDEATASLAPLETEHARIGSLRAPINAEADATLETLKNSVEWVRTPPTDITIRALPSGQIGLSMSGWIEEEATAIDRRFSTEEGTIENVRYQALSGRLTFDVLVRSNDADPYSLVRKYSFDVRRTRYDATANEFDGRLYYTGDMILKDSTGTELRRGVAKFVSTSN
jgi:hypothetical protein